MKTISTLAIAFSLCAVGGPVRADARADVMAAFEQAIAQKSYRARMNSKAGGRSTTATIEVQPPDRFHMKSPESEVIVLPAGTWMNQGGQWMKLPMDMSSMIKSMTLATMKDSANAVQDVKVLGSAGINGCQSQTYAYRSRSQVMGMNVEADVEIAICGETGLPVRVTSVDAKNKTRTVVDYDYSADIDIRPPN